MDGRVKPGDDGKGREFLKAEGESAPEHFSVKKAWVKTLAKPANFRESGLVPPI
jgi:hypothetical protein